MPAYLHNIPPGLLRGQQSDFSSIRDATYFSDRRELRITFLSGRTFTYRDVPQSIYDAFVVSPSRGAFFNIAIRGRFQFHELPPPPPAKRH